MSCLFLQAGLGWAQDGFNFRYPMTGRKGLTPRPLFIFFRGAFTTNISRYASASNKTT